MIKALELYPGPLFLLCIIREIYGDKRKWSFCEDFFHKPGVF